MDALRQARRRLLEGLRDLLALAIGRGLLRVWPGLVNAVYDRLPYRWLRLCVGHGVFGQPGQPFAWRVSLPDGARVAMDVDPAQPYSVAYAFEFKVHDVGVRQAQHLLFRRSGPRTLYVDVGANIGTTAVYPLSRGLPCWLFEPNPALEAVARRLFARNGYATARWHAVALSDRVGEATLHVSPTSYLSSLDPEFASAHGAATPLQVPLRTLDSYLPEIRACADEVILKIDVEGHELGVLRGAAALLAAFQPALIVEVLARPRAEIWTFMQAAGYRMFGLLDTGSLATVAMPTFEELERFDSYNFLCLPQGHWAVAELPVA